MTNAKDNRGSISKNKRKEKDTHPDIKGSAVIGGVAYWISGWARDSDDGPWYSLSFEEKEQQRAPSRETPRPSPRAVPQPDPAPGFDDDDIPF